MRTELWKYITTSSPVHSHCIGRELHSVADEAGSLWHQRAGDSNSSDLILDIELDQSDNIL